MIISEKYGPQLDTSDGTIGELKLVERFVVTYLNSNGFRSSFRPLQGPCTFYSKESADLYCESVLRSNPKGSYGSKFTTGLRAEKWWCYPVHFDPIAPVENE